MASEEIFTAAVFWMSFYGEFLKEVIDEIGLQKTITLYRKHGENHGAMIICELQKLGAFNPKVLGTIMEKAYKLMGINLEIEVKSDSLVVKVGRCPIYEGLKMAGLDEKTIDKLCTNREGACFSTIIEAFPEVIASLKRNKPDGYCIIVYKI